MAKKNTTHTAKQDIFVAKGNGQMELLRAYIAADIPTLLWSHPGCIAGDVHIPYKTRDANGVGHSPKGGSIEHLYHRFNNVPYDTTAPGKYVRPASMVNEPQEFVVDSMDEDGKIMPNEIGAVIFSGVKKCLRIRTESGFELVCTHDHPISVGDSFMRADKLEVGSTVMTQQHKRWNSYEGGRRAAYRPQVYVKHHPYAKTKTVRVSSGEYDYKAFSRARAVYEAHLNGISLEQYVSRLNDGILKGLKFANPKDDIHHIDEDPLNDVPSNLEAIPHLKHAGLHMTLERSRTMNAFEAVEDIVESIDEVGERKTYDITMKNAPHNFVAAGVVVHNCGKTAAVTALAEDAGAHLEVLIGSQLDPIDVGGYLVPHGDGETATVNCAPPPWARRIRNALDQGKPTWLFLDELSCAPPSVQAALLRVVQDRAVADISIRGARVLAASNPVDSAADGGQLSAATANRWAHIDWHVSPPDWVTGVSSNWGKGNAPEAAASIASWISHSPGALLAMPKEAGRAWPSPRSWSNAIASLAMVGTDSPVARQLVAGCVGDAAATEWATWRSALDLPDAEDLLSGKFTIKQLKDLRGDQIGAALLSLVTAALRERPDTLERIDRAWTILSEVRPDVALTAARGLLEATGEVPDQARDLGRRILTAKGAL